MKTTTTLTIALCSLAVLCASCGKDKPAPVTPAPTDSIATPAADTTKADTTPVVEFTTPDLLMFGLHGHVKSISYKDGAYDGSVKAEFDRNGKLTRHVESSNNYKPHRNAQGLITSETLTNPSAPVYEEEIIYTYRNDRPIRISRGNDHYSGSQVLDANCNVTSEVVDYQHSGRELTECTYRYTKFDEHGNWTSRTVSARSKSWCDENDFDEEGNEIDKLWEKLPSATQTRKIVYYTEE